jgi:hypothetical protein
MSAKADIIANEEFAKGLPMKRKKSKVTKVKEKEVVEELSADEIGPSDESAHQKETERPKKRSKELHALPNTSKPGADSHDEVAGVDKVVPRQRRGRPSKASAEKSAPIIEDSDMDYDEIEATQKPVGKKAQKAPSKSKEIVASDEDEDDDSGDANTIHVPSHAPPAKPNNVPAPPQSTPPPKPTKGLQTPTKPSTPHSPLHSGKVPYRVGLSKRNRIAPLLKIIRK